MTDGGGIWTYTIDYGNKKQIQILRKISITDWLVVVF